MTRALFLAHLPRIQAGVAYDLPDTEANARAFGRPDTGGPRAPSPNCTCWPCVNSVPEPSAAG